MEQDRDRNRGRGDQQRDRRNETKDFRQQITFFVDIEQREVPRIVGKGGSNIHRIQDEAGKGVFIRSPPRDVEPHEDGTVSFQIRGRPDAVFTAATLLQENLPAPVTFSALEMNLGRPSDVALLIGPAGASVRSIMKTCEVKVVTRPKEDRSDLVVIEGLPDNVKRAYDMSVEVIEKAKKEKETSGASDYRSSRTVAAAAPSASASGSSSTSKPAEGGGGRGRGNKSSSGSDRDWSLGRAPKFAGSAAPPQSSKGEEVERAEPEAKEELPFPQGMAGMLYGHEGNTVKAIKRKSKAATVYVDSKACVVRLAGTQAQIDKAKVLIAEVLAREPKVEKQADGGGAEKDQA